MPDSLAALERLETRVLALEKNAERMEDTISDIKHDTGQLLDLFRAGKVGASAFRWCVVIGAAFATMWVAFHNKIIG
jgi:hypothetical protein